MGNISICGSFATAYCPVHNPPSLETLKARHSASHHHGKQGNASAKHCDSASHLQGCRSGSRPEPGSQSHSRKIKLWLLCGSVQTSGMLPSDHSGAQVGQHIQSMLAPELWSAEGKVQVKTVMDRSELQQGCCRRETTALLSSKEQDCEDSSHHAVQQDMGLDGRWGRCKHIRQPEWSAG